MQDNADKYLDDLTRKVMKVASIEKSSFNFTDTVMSQVNELSKSNVTVYKPLISKKTWILISVGFLATIIYLIIKGESNTTSWLSTVDYSVISNNRLTNIISNFAISKTVSYGILLFGLMFCVQIPFLKHHFNQRFAN